MITGCSRKPRDEHSAFVIRGRIHRAAHGVEPAGAEPCFGRREECVRDFLIVRAFKESEKPDAVGVKLVVRAILDGGDAADRLSVSQREKELPVGLAIEWIGFPIERVADRDAKRRHPLRVLRAIVDLPREIDKTAQLAR